MKHDTDATTQQESLRAAAELIGTLLLREVGTRELQLMREPELAASLEELGIELPKSEQDEAWIEARGADYHDLFLKPEQGPLVQSLWTQGRYEGDSTVRVRKLAEFAGVEFSRSAARGAAPDHLGSLLLLWAATDGRTQEVADEIASAHLAWATPPLQSIESSGGFYGAIARVAAGLTATLTQGSELG